MTIYETVTLLLTAFIAVVAAGWTIAAWLKRRGTRAEGVLETTLKGLAEDVSSNSKGIEDLCQKANDLHTGQAVLKTLVSELQKGFESLLSGISPRSIAGGVRSG